MKQARCVLAHGPPARDELHVLEARAIAFDAPAMSLGRGDLRPEIPGSVSSPSSQRASPAETWLAFSSLPSFCPYPCSWFAS